MTDLKSILLPGIDPAAPLIIAGPCSAETREQVMDTARGLCDMGVKVFRAGIWKPRTKPGCFEGVGEEGLQWLGMVKAETGMYTATEVANRHHVEAAVGAGVDLLWIGARTTANPFAVQEIADTLAEVGDPSMPLLVKNPVNQDIELWIGALQRLYNAGFHRLGAIHRGFTAQGTHLYRNMPDWHIPIELHLRYPQLPIICDPSHIGGRRELVQSISQQALDMGFNGLMIESHVSPEEAWSDSRQQITPGELGRMMESLIVRGTSGPGDGLELLRRQIDEIDRELLEILSRRMQVSHEIGRYKREHRIPVVQSDRFNDVLRSRVAAGEEMGLNPGFLKTVLLAIHEESVGRQIDIQEDGAR
ncbi:MAG: bifunctional 3-deoxy-7-phosphoheptulonate synthase/chorismate mutase type II [Muribaculaceae bacterium]|nr:bifunctional 3-deoxy-7-phosphoheptulonate synthase/chorismate mutase type II [Muribaculaceae bacterium]